MKVRPIRFLLFGLSLLALITFCPKINEATDLGDDIILIPGVDGVTTFDTTITVETYNNII